MARPQPENPAAHDVQVRLLRAATTARRFGLARSLSETTIELALFEEFSHRVSPLDPFGNDQDAPAIAGRIGYWMIGPGQP
jgi:hypothetical protein